MCEAVTAAVSIASALIGTAATIQQANSQEDWANYQAKQAEADANAEAKAAQVQANQIREAGKKQRAQARAALAASGVDVNEGTAININEEIYKNAEEDALNTIFGGVDRQQRGYAQAQADRMRGEQSATAGKINAAGSLLGAGYQAYNSRNVFTSKSGWRV